MLPQMLVNSFYLSDKNNRMQIELKMKINRYTLSAFYRLAGINHFLFPTNYYALIPGYLPFPVLINVTAGISEISVAILLLFTATRNFAVTAIIVILFLFIPAHIYMIQKGGCMSAAFCLPEWVAWLRLFPLQFILIYWAWTNRK
jgi:uncharacterized membrane protein